MIVIIFLLFMFKVKKELVTKYRLSKYAYVYFTIFCNIRSSFHRIVSEMRIVILFSGILIPRIQSITRRGEE